MKKSNALLLSVLGVLVVMLITTSVTYAFFSTSFGDGASTDQIITTGNLDHIMFTDGTGSNTLISPIYDKDKSTKSIKHSFSLENKGSNTPSCSSIYLIPNKIGVKTNNGIDYLKYLKFELVDLSNPNVPVSEGNVSMLSAGIPYLLTDVSLSANSKNNYELRLWLSYDPVEDQTFLLSGNDAASSLFEGNITIETNAGAC